jgi:hypothetical protein
MTIEIVIKKCNRCGLEKDIQKFHRRRDRCKRGGGRQSYCIECEKLNNKENYNRNKNGEE